MLWLGIPIALLTAVVVPQGGFAAAPDEAAGSNLATGCLRHGKLFDVALGTEPRRGVCPKRAKTITFPIQPPAENGDGSGVLTTYPFHTTLTSDRPDADIPFEVLDIPIADTSILVQAWCTLQQEDELRSTSSGTLMMDGDYHIAIINEDNEAVRIGSRAHLTEVKAALASPSNHDVDARTHVVKLGGLANEGWLRLETFITVSQSGDSPATCTFSGKAELFGAPEES